MAGSEFMYRYFLSSTGESSRKYGECEICEKHASEVFYQTEEREYEIPLELRNELGREKWWTCEGCCNHFGHRACLIQIRREPHVEIAFEQWQVLFDEMRYGN